MYLEKHQVPAYLRHGYNGSRLRAEPCETVTVPMDAGLWSGGSRDVYSAIELATGREIPFPGQSLAPTSERKERIVELRPGFAVVKKSMFRGNDMGLLFYVHPADVTKLLPDSGAENLSDDDVYFLAVCRGIKSGYRADYYRRKGWTDDKVVSIKARMIDGGYLLKTGAITVKGKNASGKTNP